MAGEVDIATAPDLNAATLDALAVHRHGVIDVDLSACTFLDCSGIRVLIAAHTTAQASGCQMRVSHPRRLVCLVMKVTGLLDMFTAANDMAGRLASGHEAGHLGFGLAGRVGEAGDGHGAFAACRRLILSRVRVPAEGDRP